MSVFAQRLTCMRCACPMMLRLCYQRNYPCVGSFSKRKLSTSTWPRVHNVAFTQINLHQSRKLAVLATDYQQIVDDTKNLLESRKTIRENDYAHNLFLNSIHYKETVMQPNVTYTHVTNKEALEILEQEFPDFMTQKQIPSMIKKLSHNISCSKESDIEPFKYKSIFDKLHLYCQQLSNDDLMIVIRHLVPFKNCLTNCEFYKTFCQHLDKECIQRFSHLPINETLLLCDTLYLILPEKSQYIWYSVRKLGNKPQKLNPHQLVQVLFFLNVCRKPPINMYELEYCLEQCMDDLSINELGVASLGFFKTRTSFRSTEFLHRIMKKSIAEMDNVDSVSIGALLKQMRYSMQLSEIPTLEELMKALVPHISRFTLMSLTHIAHICAKVALYDKEVIDKIIERFNSELKTARLKDIERLVFVFSSLNIDRSNSIYRNVIEELRTTWNTSRANEISMFPQVASRILGYLAVLNIYPTDLIKHVMSPHFIYKAVEKCYFLSREYCVLDYGLRIEVPEYDGPFLKPSTLIFLEKKHFDLSSKTTTAKSRSYLLLTSVLETCKEIFNTTSNLSVIRPLPHYTLPDIVFCLNEQNQLVPTSEFLSQFNSSDIKRVDTDEWNDVRWIALVIAPPLFLLRPSNLPTGSLAAKIRQLSIIGYTPVLISQANWIKCRTAEEKRNYIKNFIFKNNVSEQSSR